MMLRTVLLAASIVSPASNYLSRLENRLNLAAVQPSMGEIAGRYSHPGPDLRKLVPPLSGSDLYLFPNGSYIYTEWADIMPETVLDRGHWSVVGGILKLQSSAAITWQPRNEKQYVVVRYKDRPAHLFLLGIEWSLAYLDEHAGRNADFMFLLTTLGFSERFPNWRETQSAVLKRSWNSKLFRHE